MTLRATKTRTTQTVTGTSFLVLLTLLFIALKLTGFIDWSWWWVLAPAWGPYALALTLFVIAGFFHLLARFFHLLADVQEWWARRR